MGIGSEGEENSENQEYNMSNFIEVHIVLKFGVQIRSVTRLEIDKSLVLKTNEKNRQEKINSSPITLTGPLNTPNCRE